MKDLKKAFDELFTFSDEEKVKLDAATGELLEFLKERKLTAKEALYVINKCEHIVYTSAIENSLQ